ncbi:MAG TPA: hypothetical protein VFB33_03430 [Candidatus Binataceae bacterium]|nr:hypothetical protein [Candidatus Binataceae bacterium]
MCGRRGVPKLIDLTKLREADARGKGRESVTVAQGNQALHPHLLELERWINLHAIQALVHHATGMIVALIVFAIVARLAIYLLPHNRVRYAVVIIDDIVLIGLVAWFGWELFVYLWNRRERLGELRTAARAGATFAGLHAPRLSVVLKSLEDSAGWMASLTAAF